MRICVRDPSALIESDGGTQLILTALQRLLATNRTRVQTVQSAPLFVLYRTRLAPLSLSFAISWRTGAIPFLLHWWLYFTSIIKLNNGHPANQ